MDLTSKRRPPERYRLLDIDITGSLPPIEFSMGESGAALLVRRKRRPIGFLMRQKSEEETLSADEISLWIGGSLKNKIVEEAIREDLPVAGADHPFPSLSVSICTRGRSDRLKRCLDSVVRLQRKSDFELLVIDNAPPDHATAELATYYPGVRYIVEPRPGLDFARNRALLESTGDLIAYLDDDVVVDSGWLMGLQEAWSENQDAMAFTGLVMPLVLDTRAQVLFERRDGFRRGFDKKRFGRELPGNPLYPCGAGIFGAGCNMAFRRDLLLELGGFDEALDTGAPLPGGGDLDIFYRVIRGGGVLVYEPRYMVFHEHRASEAALRRQYYTWGLGFMAFVDKSYRSDPDQRSQLRRLVAWWVKDQTKQLLQALRGKHVLPFSMIFAEIRGGIIGLCREYSRSLRRIAAIRKNIG